MGVILCYIQAVFAILSFGTFGPWVFLILVGLVGGGFGIANEKKWGYFLAVATAVLQVGCLVARRTQPRRRQCDHRASRFDVLLVVLLSHPMSRSYQRIWFK